MLKLQFFTDPGHGWIKVKKTDLVKLGIADKISPYSYMRTDFAYLEEDCDASLYLGALKQRGIEFQLLNLPSSGNSRVRSYQRYVA
ncbi:MAG: hypothetical protein EBY22_02945 [Gammaproteobacteria bacterium]|jgi:hypothetical protein|nr:hypothetical protein [Gammaproteobacteria bacterium]